MAVCGCTMLIVEMVSSCTFGKQVPKEEELYV